MNKIKKVIIIFISLIIALSFLMINLNEIDEIHQLDYIESEFRRLPFYHSDELEFPSNGSQPLFVGEWKVNEKIKQDLSFAIKSEIQKAKILVPRFRVQIIGYSYNDERYIWFNGFCFSFFGDTKHIWKEKYVSFLSRGLCTFEGLYDVKARKIDRFYWGNGENIKEKNK